MAWMFSSLFRFLHAADPLCALVPCLQWLVNSIIPSSQRTDCMWSSGLCTKWAFSSITPTISSRNNHCIYSIRGKLRHLLTAWPASHYPLFPFAHHSSNHYYSLIQCIFLPENLQFKGRPELSVRYILFMAHHLEAPTQIEFIHSLGDCCTDPVWIELTQCMALQYFSPALANCWPRWRWLRCKSRRLKLWRF